MPKSTAVGNVVGNVGHYVTWYTAAVHVVSRTFARVARSFARVARSFCASFCTSTVNFAGGRVSRMQDLVTDDRFCRWISLREVWLNGTHSSACNRLSHRVALCCKHGDRYVWNRTTAFASVQQNIRETRPFHYTSDFGKLSAIFCWAKFAVKDVICLRTIFTEKNQFYESIYYNISR